MPPRSIFCNKNFLKFFGKKPKIFSQDQCPGIGTPQRLRVPSSVTSVVLKTKKVNIYVPQVGLVNRVNSKSVQNYNVRGYNILKVRYDIFLFGSVFFEFFELGICPKTGTPFFYPDSKRLFQASMNCKQLFLLILFLVSQKCILPIF